MRNKCQPGTSSNAKCPKLTNVVSFIALFPFEPHRKTYATWHSFSDLFVIQHKNLVKTILHYKRYKNSLFFDNVATTEAHLLTAILLHPLCCCSKNYIE